ncbi:MAG: hypothetical protein ACR2NF_10045 [Pirellulales bacterium]
MKEISQRAAANLRSGSGSKKSKNRAGVIAGTDIGKDMERLSNDLSKNRLRRVIHKMNTAVRRETVKNLKKASSSTRIGESMRGKMTRGDWKNPSTTRNGVRYLAGGWYGQVLKSRGNVKPSMAYNGGEDGLRGGGMRGIISRTVPSSGGKLLKGITGPRHSGSTGDDGDNGRYGYNYAHMLEFGGNHVNWDSKKNRKSMLQARPFLGPAGNNTMPKQISIMKKELRNWGMGK